MNVFKYSMGLFDRKNGAKMRRLFNKRKNSLDPMQEYVTVGEYHVDKAQLHPKVCQII